MRTVTALLLAGWLAACAAPVSDEPNDYLIVPGVRAGPFLLEGTLVRHMLASAEGSATSSDGGVHVIPDRDGSVQLLVAGDWYHTTSGLTVGQHESDLVALFSSDPNCSRTDYPDTGLHVWSLPGIRFLVSNSRVTGIRVVPLP